jgi:hypothetical protein
VNVVSAVAVQLGFVELGVEEDSVMRYWVSELLESVTLNDATATVVETAVDGIVNEVMTGATSSFWTRRIGSLPIETVFATIVFGVLVASV